MAGLATLEHTDDLCDEALYALQLEKHLEIASVSRDRFRQRGVLPIR